MYRLIKKDFIASWMFIGIATLLIPFLTSISLWAMMDDFGGIALGFITFLTVAMCFLTSLIFILVDTTAKTDTTYAGFPIERAEIVLARYASSFMLTIYSLSLVVFTIWVLSAISNESDKAFAILLSIRGVIGIFVFLILIISFSYPFIFKFGTSKGTVIYLSVMMFIGLLEPLISFLNKALSGIIVIDLSVFKTAFESTIKFVRLLPTTEIYLLLFSLLLVTVFTSILLSIRFYSKRDL